MSHLVLVHWKPAEVAEEIAALQQAGHQVEVYSQQGGVGLARFKQPLPDAVVISLERLPSHGRAIGHWFRTTKATASIPLVFIGGESVKVESVRTDFPDAVFCAWSKVRQAVSQALCNPQAAQPPALVSNKTLWRKLEIRPGDRVLQLGGPVNLRELLGAGLPPQVTVFRRVQAQV